MSRFDRVPVHIGLVEPHCTAAESPLAKLLEGRLKALGKTQPLPQQGVYDFWPASFYNLDRVGLYNDASADQKRKILCRCARGLLHEAYFIEKSGLSYCAKMILLAETTDVKQAYSHIAADEATHLQWITPYIPEEERGRPSGAFLEFLGGLVEQCDANTLAYLVQVILEGWGLHHYSRLAKGCLDSNLQNLLRHIYRDEAMHHRAGEIVFDGRLVSSSDEKLIANALRTYTEFVRVGPQEIVTAVEQVLGGLSSQQKLTVFTELQCERTSAKKLNILRDLMSVPAMESQIASLEEMNCFTPYSPEACVALHAREIL